MFLPVQSRARITDTPLVLDDNNGCAPYASWPILLLRGTINSVIWQMMSTESGDEFDSRSTSGVAPPYGPVR